MTDQERAEIDLLRKNWGADRFRAEAAEAERDKLTQRVKQYEEVVSGIFECDECRLCKQDRRAARAALAEAPQAGEGEEK